MAFTSHTPQALILVEEFVNYQMTNTPLNLEKVQSTLQNIEKEQKHLQYLEKDRYTPQTKMTEIPQKQKK